MGSYDRWYLNLQVFFPKEQDEVFLLCYMNFFSPHSLDMAQKPFAKTDLLVPVE